MYLLSHCSVFCLDQELTQKGGKKTQLRILVSIILGEGGSLLMDCACLVPFIGFEFSENLKKRKEILVPIRIHRDFKGK